MHRLDIRSTGLKVFTGCFIVTSHRFFVRVHLGSEFKNLLESKRFYTPNSHFC